MVLWDQSCSCDGLVHSQAWRALLDTPAASPGATCVAYVPFRASDYEYMQGLAIESRRESFAAARERGTNVTGTVSADGPWTLEGLAGESYGGSGAQALSAFPQVDKRTDDVYQAFFIASIAAATGVDVADSIGQATQRPYYSVRSVCKGASCSSLSQQEWSQLQQEAGASRGVISCADTATLAADPAALPLPFGTSGAFCLDREKDSSR